MEIFLEELLTVCMPNSPMICNVFYLSVNLQVVLLGSKLLNSKVFNFNLHYSFYMIKMSNCFLLCKL